MSNTNGERLAVIPEASHGRIQEVAGKLTRLMPHFFSVGVIGTAIGSELGNHQASIEQGVAMGAGAAVARLVINAIEMFEDRNTHDNA